MSSAPIMLHVQVARLVEVMLARLCSPGYARELVARIRFGLRPAMLAHFFITNLVNMCSPGLSF